MIKQSTSSRKAVKDFQKQLALQLYLCRIEKNIRLKQVAKATGWSLDMLESIELGQLPVRRIWRVLRLLKLYGKKLRIEVCDTADNP